MKNFTTIQSIVFPGKIDEIPTDLYLKGEVKSGKIGLEFLNQESVRFDTFYNLFNVSKMKSICSFSSVFLTLNFRGRFSYKIIHSHPEEGTDQILCGNEIFSDFEKSAQIPIHDWPDLSDGYLWLQLKALSDGVLFSAFFETLDRPVHEVNLGVVIVHFNRKQWVIPALQRLRTELLDDPDYSGKISLAVIDNSRNITSDESSGVSVIPNGNFGGSGGFARGLLYFKDKGFTHCLFMDDDASCEVESIKRSWALLSYSTQPKFAIAGSLLREQVPYELYEKGAIFGLERKALKNGLDMRLRSHLAFAESEGLTPNYGAWWFFAFAIKDIAYFPFPFFVRGDDIMFSLLNGFSIYTTNGIACWGEDFSYKQGPLQNYLDTRSFLVNGIVSLQEPVWRHLAKASKSFLRNLLTLNYASACAICLAIEHSLLGIDFWIKNLDMARIRSEIMAYSPSEKMLPIDPSIYDSDQLLFPGGPDPLKEELGDQRESRWGAYLKLILLNGALLPNFLLKKRVLLCSKTFFGFDRAFRYRRILYFRASDSTGYLAELDRFKLLKVLFRYLIALTKIGLFPSRYRRNLYNAVRSHTQESFWRNLYHC